MEDLSLYNQEGSTLRKLQLRLLDILVEVDRICRKNNIQYWIDFGTLLGAVRHGGFIPWDDDVDISMPSEDYQRFLEIAPKELSEPYFLQTNETDSSYRLPLNKVRDKNSFFVTQHEDFTRDYHKGIFIDIFEITSYPTVNPKLQKLIMHWLLKTNFFFSVKQDPSIKNVVATITFPFLKFGVNSLWNLLCIKPKNKLGYNKNFSVYGNSYSKDIVFPIKNIAFEGKTFFGPANPDRYLTSIYGDYMKLPPKEGRRTHIIHVEIK